MAAVEDAQTIVDSVVASAIGTTLVRWRLQGGIVFLSAPVGAAGRIYVGDPMHPSDNVVIVSASASGLSLVRELCIPQMREAVSSFAIGQFDEYVATQAWSRAAVVCAERLIENHVPHYTQAYRDTFMETARGMSAAEFAEVFAIDPRIGDWIDVIIRN